MTPSRWLLLAATLSAMLTLTGCNQGSTGTPMPDDTKTTTSQPGTANTTPPNERPREIDLDGKDPCALIPQADWPKFDIEQPGKQSEEPNLKSARCFYPGVGDLTLVVTEGIEAWEERDRDAEITDTEPIEGFPAITIWNEVDRRSCYTGVDVADGQYLLTAALSVNADIDKAESCDLAYQLAESAMKTLVAS